MLILTSYHPGVVYPVHHWIWHSWLLTPMVYIITDSFFVPLDVHSMGFDRCIPTYLCSLSCDTETFYCSRNPLCPRVSCFPEPVMSTDVFTFLVLSCLEYPRVGVLREWAVQGSFFHPSHAHTFNLSVQLSCSFLFRVSWHLLFACTCRFCSTEGQWGHVPICNNYESNCLKYA